MKNKTILELLQNYVEIIEELKNRNVLRTGNNPSGDYAEYLVTKKMNLELAPNSEKSFDASDKNKMKYQIKARRKRSRGNSNQLGVMRSLDFDSLIVVIFNENFTVNSAYQIPADIIDKYAIMSKCQKGYILNLKSGVLVDNKVADITKKII